MTNRQTTYELDTFMCTFLVCILNCFCFVSKEKHFLPDVVATTTEAKPKHRLKDFEDLEAENDRLKAIFQMHSIKISENSKPRRNSDPDKAAAGLTELLPCDNTKRSSMSSDSSSTKYEDVKMKVT